MIAHGPGVVRLLISLLLAGLLATALAFFREQTEKPVQPEAIPMTVDD